MVTPEEHKERLDLYQEGLTDSQIAEKIFTTRPNITYWRNKNGLKPNRCRRWSPKELEKLFALRNRGLTLESIARRYGLCEWTIRNVLRNKKRS